jgi:hypothetical protein
LDKDSFRKAILEQGFCLVPGVLSKYEVSKLRKATEDAIAKEAAFHGSTDYKDYGVVQACPMYGGEFLNLLDNRKFMDPFNWVMGEGSILYVYISSSMPPHGKNASTRVHVDRPRVFDGYCECLAGLVLLDDFTRENGSTYYLPKSQYIREEPNSEYFYQHAKQIEAPAGSVFYFNLRLWHAGGENKTDRWRHALALGVVRPYLKQRFDLPKMLEKHNVDISKLSEYAKQKLGYNAIPPAGLDEFYGDPSRRTYKEIPEWQVVKEERAAGLKV